MAVKSKIVLILILVVAFVVSAIVHLPIQAVLTHAPLPSQLKIAGASGSLWQGQVQQLQWQHYNLGQVSWQLQPMQLLTGNLQAKVRLGRGNPWQLRARGVVGYGFTRGVRGKGDCLDARNGTDEARSVNTCTIRYCWAT